MEGEGTEVVQLTSAVNIFILVYWAVWRPCNLNCCSSTLVALRYLCSVDLGSTPTTMR